MENGRINGLRETWEKPDEHTSYIKISLLRLILKTFEELVLEGLEPFLEERQLRQLDLFLVLGRRNKAKV